MSYNIKGQSWNNDKTEDDEGQALGGTNITGCVPGLSGQASCPLIITIRCTHLYQQLTDIKGSILQLLVQLGDQVWLFRGHLFPAWSSPDMSESLVSQVWSKRWMPSHGNGSSF